LSDILIIVGGKNKNIFPTYRPIGRNAESERGNKEYFNLGLTKNVIVLGMFILHNMKNVPNLNNKVNELVLLR
jgi:hypothetical protein